MFNRVPRTFAVALAAGLCCCLPAFSEQQEKGKKPPRGYVERGPIDANVGGARLTQDQVDALEQRLADNPRDSSSRIKLLMYYHGKRTSAARAAHLEHLLWLIANDPGARYSGMPFCRINGNVDEEGYERARTMWLEQVAAHPRDTGVIGNAARFMMLYDKQIAEDLLNMAKAIEPGNQQWPKLLATINLPKHRAKDSEEDSDPKKATLLQIEEAYELTSSEMQKMMLLSGMAKAAYEAGEYDKAESYAKRALAAVESLSAENAQGEAIHQGNIVLGRIALRNGGIHKAKEYLMAAGRTPGSPTLNSLGPSMGLAKELLEIDEDRAVLEYLDLCGEFWKGGADKLPAWKAVIEEGGIPDFKANLFY
jgi:hypothetical protein